MLPPEKSQYIIDKHNETSKELGKFIVELIARRTLQVKAEELTFSTLVRLDDDIVTRMLRTDFPKQMDFDIKRLGLNAGGLLIGAIETTAQAVAQIVQYLLDRPEWLAKAKTAAGAQTPADFDGYVWEALRFVPITPYLFRTTASDYAAGQGNGSSKPCCIPAHTSCPSRYRPCSTTVRSMRQMSLIRSAIGITISISVSVVMNAWAGMLAGK